MGILFLLKITPILHVKFKRKSLDTYIPTYEIYLHMFYYLNYISINWIEHIVYVYVGITYITHGSLPYIDSDKRRRGRTKELKINQRKEN